MLLLTPFLQEKEKKNMFSLVEAALDEESDSDTEMEVVINKVGIVFVVCGILV